MASKILFIRIEDFLFDRQRWDINHINEHRKLLNLWIDKGYEICLVSTMDVSNLQEVQKNFYIADTGYLIGCDGGEIYNISSKKQMLNTTFKIKELPFLERIVERLDFDNMNTALITFWREGNNRSILNNSSEQYHKKMVELEKGNVIVNTLTHFPKDDASISRVTLKFPSKINRNETLALLKSLAPNFNYIINEENTIEILPNDSTLKNAIDYICSKDKKFSKTIAEKNVISIGYTKSDIYLFDLSKQSYTLVSCPYEISGKASKTFMGEISSIVSYTVKEILKTE